MLRTDTVKPLPRVGAGTRSTRNGASTNQRARSTRDHAVEVVEKRFGYFPQRFRWRGRSHSVHAVERCWTRTGRSPRLCFRVRCQEGVFDLTQNVKTNLWTLAVVQLAS